MDEGRCSNCCMQFSYQSKNHSILVGKREEAIAMEEFDSNVSVSGGFEYLFGVRRQETDEDDLAKFLCQACSSVFTELYHSKEKLLRKSHVSSLLYKIHNTSTNPLASITSENLFSGSEETEEDGESILPCDKNEAGILQRNSKFYVCSPNVAKSDCQEMKELFPILKIGRLKNFEGIGNHLVSKNIYWPCSICQRVFSAKDLLENHHEAVHSDSFVKYQCSLCNKKFSCDWFLKNHINFAHDGISIQFKFKCDKCEIQLSSEVELKSHRLEIHDIRNRPFNCKHCQDSFHDISDLRGHLIEFHDGTNEAKVAASNTSLIENVQLYGRSGEMSKMHHVIYCPNCKKTFAKVNTRNEHVKLEHNGIYVCVCGKAFKCPNKWKDHHYKHGRAGSFACEICGSYCPYIDKLNIHYQIHLNYFRPPQNFCDVCGKNYSSKFSLQSHMRTHQEDRKHFKCNECNKIFKYKSVLDDHNSMFHGKGKFSCEKCSRKCLNQKGFTAHQNWHRRVEGRKISNTNDKKLGVNVNIKNDGELEVSQYYSAETSKFICPICNGSYNWKLNLIRHLRVFHQIKGFTKRNAEPLDNLTIKCPQCSKVFSRRDLMKRHITDVHKVELEMAKSIKCDICCQEMMRSEFVRHSKMHQTVLKSKSKDREDRDLASFYCPKTKMFICDICECKTEFNCKLKFLGHSHSYHNYTAINDRSKATLNLKFKCSHCDKSYFTKSQLREHMKNVRKISNRTNRPPSEVLTGKRRYNNPL